MAGRLEGKPASQDEPLAEGPRDRDEKVEPGRERNEHRRDGGAELQDTHHA